jgi:serine/threonine-protein kinase RsbW
MVEGICDMELQEVVMLSELGAVEKAENLVLGTLTEEGWDPEDLFSIRLALEEAITNAIKHGNKLDASKKVVVRFGTDGTQLVIQVEDEGTGFDPTSVPDPTAEENLERESGRGLLLMRYYMDNLEYNPRGNCVTMIKTLK